MASSHWFPFRRGGALVGVFAAVIGTAACADHEGSTTDMDARVDAFVPDDEDASPPGDGDASVVYDASLPGDGDASTMDDDGVCASRGRCCSGDGECGGGPRGSEMRCYPSDRGPCSVGECRARPARGECWDDRDCLGGQSCEGAVLCCGCTLDNPGTCAPPRSGGCELGPPADCCFDDAQCGTGFVCRPGVCSTEHVGTCVPAPGPTGCWDDHDCEPGCVCVDASRCPCGASCVVPDSPGTCGCAL